MSISIYLWGKDSQSASWARNCPDGSNLYDVGGTIISLLRLYKVTGSISGTEEDFMRHMERTYGDVESKHAPEWNYKIKFSDETFALYSCKSEKCYMVTSFSDIRNNTYTYSDLVDELNKYKDEIVGTTTLSNCGSQSVDEMADVGDKYSELWKVRKNMKETSSHITFSDGNDRPPIPDSRDQVLDKMWEGVEGQRFHNPAYILLVLNLLPEHVVDEMEHQLIKRKLPDSEYRAYRTMIGNKTKTPQWYHQMMTETTPSPLRATLRSNMEVGFMEYIEWLSRIQPKPWDRMGLSPIFTFLDAPPNLLQELRKENDAEIMDIIQPMLVPMYVLSNDPRLSKDQKVDLSNLKTLGNGVEKIKTAMTIVETILGQLAASETRVKGQKEAYCSIHPAGVGEWGISWNGSGNPTTLRFHKNNKNIDITFGVTKTNSALQKEETGIFDDSIRPKPEPHSGWESEVEQNLRDIPSAPNSPPISRRKLAEVTSKSRIASQVYSPGRNLQYQNHTLAKIHDPALLDHRNQGFSEPLEQEYVRSRHRREVSPNEANVPKWSSASDSSMEYRVPGSRHRLAAPKQDRQWGSTSHRPSQSRKIAGIEPVIPNGTSGANSRKIRAPGYEHASPGDHFPSTAPGDAKNGSLYPVVVPLDPTPKQPHARPRGLILIVKGDEVVVTNECYKATPLQCGWNIVQFLANNKRLAALQEVIENEQLEGVSEEEFKEEWKKFNKADRAVQLNVELFASKQLAENNALKLLENLQVNDINILQFTTLDAGFLALIAAKSLSKETKKIYTYMQLEGWATFDWKKFDWTKIGWTEYDYICIVRFENQPGFEMYNCSKPAGERSPPMVFSRRFSELRDVTLKILAKETGYKSSQGDANDRNPDGDMGSNHGSETDPDPLGSRSGTESSKLESESEPEQEPKQGTSQQPGGLFQRLGLA
jgi:hypothetical protein